VHKFLNAKSLALLLSLMIASPAYAQNSFDEDSIESELDEDDGSIVENEDPAPAPRVDNVQRDYSPRTPEESRPSSGSSEKIFDWSKHENATEVPHPFAEKGLMRITRDRTYIYKVDETPQTRAASLRIGIFNPVNLENPDTAGQRGSTFEENYDQSTNPAIMFDYEWQLWKTAIGKIGVRAGTGIYIAQGNGHFVSAVNADQTPREIFTFWAMPNALGAVYRMQLWDRQLFVPYAEGGGIAFTFGEFRDDDRPPKWGGALAGYYAAGLAFNLTYFDALARIQLDREYGINRVYLTMEYRGIVAITQKYDFTSDLINGGFLMEF